MKFWIFTHSDQPLEHWLEGYQQRFDAWEEGGVEFSVPSSGHSKTSNTAL